MAKKCGSTTVISPVVRRRSSSNCRNCRRAKRIQRIGFRVEANSRGPLLLKYHADSFGAFFSVAFVSPDEEVFAESVFEDLSLPSDAFGADSFLAAALYDSLR